ncbi:MAG: hypothetical protein AMXMBFR23_23610 [Chloroflexota bacterium]
MKDPELLVFPIFGVSGMIAVTVIPMLTADVEEGTTIFLMVLGLVFASTSIEVLFAAALMGAVLQRLSGGDPGIRSGLRAALSRAWPLLRWTVVVTAVRFSLLIGRRRSGRGVAAAADAAWQYGSFFVIPGIMSSRASGPVEALEDSVWLIKRTWGERAAATFDFGTIYFIAILLALMGSAIFMMLVFPFSIRGAFAVPVAFVAVAFGYVSAMEAVFKAALFRYATGDNAAGLTDGFDPVDFRFAYRPVES